MKTTWVATLLGLALALASTGCDSVDRAIDCDNVCQKYNDCVANDLDLDKCTQGCRDWSENSSTNDQALDDCADCIDGQSCVNATFGCADECAFILLVSNQ